MDDTSALKPADIRTKIEKLMQRHASLDKEIIALTHSIPYDQLKVQRIKKEKLAIKDQVRFLEDMLVPDIIA